MEGGERKAVGYLLPLQGKRQVECDADYHHPVWNLTVMGNAEANHNSSEMKAMKGLYPTESAW